jgi:hypothetical protein
MEIELLLFGQSLSDKLRAAHYRWVGMPSAGVRRAECSPRHIGVNAGLLEGRRSPARLLTWVRTGIKPA